MSRPLTLSLALGFTFAALSSFAMAESRGWTDSKSKKILTGELIDKSMAGDRIQVSLDSGKTVWIDLARLVEADRKYAKDWVKSENHISTRTKASGKGWKEVGVVARGGTKGGTVIMFRYPDDRVPTRIKIEPGQTRDLSFRGTNKWVVHFIIDETIADKEDATHKTGLRDRR